VTKRPIFAFIDPKIRPNDAIVVFTFQDDYSFGILQSNVHWEWFTERCSTLKGDFRYTNSTVFDSFPWPQSATRGGVRRVAMAARDLRVLRRQLIKQEGVSLRTLYRSLELPGRHPLKDAHETLDNAVRSVYGISSQDETLEFLFSLNQELARREEANDPVVGPGLPPCVSDAGDFITNDFLPL
jgi:hypothetical protein